MSLSPRYLQSCSIQICNQVCNHGCDPFLIGLQQRTASVDLATDTSLLVDISDALSEQDKVKFTVHTKVHFNIKHFQFTECVVDVRPL